MTTSTQSLGRREHDGFGSPSLDGFLAHARRFGPECVVATASDYLSERDLARLGAEIALLDAARTRPACRPFGRGADTCRRRSESDLREQVRALDERGLVASAIADALRTSDRRVRRLLGELGQSENGGRDLSIHAGKRARIARTR